MKIEQLMPKQNLTAALEIIINKTLSLDPDINPYLDDISGKSLTITLTELDFPLTFLCQGNSINVFADSHSELCSISVSISSLPKLKQSKLLTSLIKSGELDIEGDPKVAQQFAKIGEQLSIDWEQQLANRFGDIAAYKLHQLVLNLTKKLNFAKQQVSQDASEFLLYEKPVIVAAHQQNDFNLAVSVLEQQTADLELKLHQLSSKIQQLNS